MTSELKLGLAGAFCLHLLMVPRMGLVGEAVRYEVTVFPSSLEVSLVDKRKGPSTPIREMKRPENQTGIPASEANRYSSERDAVANPLRGVFKDAIPYESYNDPPHYPRAARVRHYEGRVVLRVWVSGEGRVSGVKIVHSSGHQLLDEAAKKAVSRWRFYPAVRFTIPVASTVEIPVVFRLEKENPRDKKPA